MGITVCSIGHSNRSLDEFVALLRECGATRVADVRSVPRSRHNPQFDIASLPDSLRQAGIGYEHVAGLGGFRRAHADSPNTGWRNLAFRGYADYMGTDEFRTSLDHLIELAGSAPTAMMCAEAVPWHCHRSLIADALLARGLTVVDAVSPGHLTPHTMTPFARTEGAVVTYPERDRTRQGAGTREA